MSILKKIAWLRSSGSTGRLYKAQKYDQALKCAEMALRMAEEAYGPNHINTNRSLYNLVVVHRAKKEYNKAEEYGKRAIAITEENRGIDDPGLIIDLENLLAVYKEAENEEGIEEIKERIEEIKEKNNKNV